MRACIGPSLSHGVWLSWMQILVNPADPNSHIYKANTANDATR